MSRVLPSPSAIPFVINGIARIPEAPLVVLAPYAVRWNQHSSVKLAALIVLGVPATVIPILFMGRRVRRLSRLNQDRVADVSAHIDESLHEIRTVQAYRHELRTAADFNAAAEAAYAAGGREAIVRDWVAPDGNASTRDDPDSWEAHYVPYAVDGGRAKTLAGGDGAPRSATMGRMRGTATEKAVPLPTRERKLTVWPSRRESRSTIANPNPSPLSRLRWGLDNCTNSRKISSLLSAGIPLPVSHTSMLSDSPRRRQPTTTPPLAV